MPAKSGPLRSAPQEESFARQCTLQAVFDWYQAFSDGEVEESPLLLSDRSSADDPGHRASRHAGIDTPIPGFPQFARQVIDTEQDTIRVRFFYPGGREAGVLLLRREANSCVIEVPDGPLYVVSHAKVLADLTLELEGIPTLTSSTGETESLLRVDHHGPSPTSRVS